MKNNNCLQIREINLNTEIECDDIPKVNEVLEYPLKQNKPKI